MGRIVEAQRIPTVDATLGHYAEAEVVNGGPILVAPGVGRPQLLAKRDQYHTLQDELIDLDETQVPMLIAERTAVWGNSPDDEDGIWFQLRHYKAMVRLRLGARHPLAKTVPNLGEVQPRTMGSICHRFEDHWTRVNAALAALTQPAMTLGAFTLASLQAAHAAIEAKNAALEAILEGSRPLTRAEMERLYGDVPENDREEDSIVAIMLGYEVVIQTTFPGQPIALSLPQVFPLGLETPLPTFAFNWVAQPAGVVKTWFALAALPPGSAIVFFQEGVVELTAPVTASPSGGMQVDLWNGVTLVDELDQFEIRNGDGVTIARGLRDPSLAEPT